MSTDECPCREIRCPARTHYTRPDTGVENDWYRRNVRDGA